MNRFIFSLIIGFFVLPIFAAEVPSLTGPVVDAASLFSSSEFSQLDSAIRNYKNKTGNQFQILTVKTLDGEPIETFSIRVAEKWQIGDKEKDNGILIVASKEDRKIRIEVGSGLEGELPDIFCGRVIRQVMTPEFRKSNFATGFAAAMISLSDRLGEKIVFSNFRPSRRTYRRRKNSGFFILLVFFLIFMFARNSAAAYGSKKSGCMNAILWGFILTLLNGRGGGGGFSSGGFGGGGWSGGGGGFSGGGASGGW